jgi:hypothetical protein
MKITAAQHVSAMLTSRQSPRGDAGYQTLYYTRELLTPNEVSVIERLVQYSSVRESRPKWQSYRLSARRHVVTRVVPIDEPDEAGRTGRYFTHSLVCDMPGEQQFAASLLSLLRPQNFLPSLGDVLASDGMKTGRCPTFTVDPADESGEAGRRRLLGRLRDWSGEQLNRLFMLMSDPRQLTERGQYLALLGSDEQIIEALKVAFLLVPPAALKLCSFDTNPSGSASPPEGAFWGRGAAAAGESSYTIDAAQQQITLPESSPLRSNGFSPELVSEPLRKAVVARLSRPSDAMLRRLAEHQYVAFIGEPLCQTLLSEAELPLTRADSELLARFGSKRNPGLSLLLALKSGDDAGRLRALAAMDAPSYRECVRQLKARPGFEPWQAFSPVFTPTWFELFRGAYGPDDLTTAVAKVAEHGSGEDMDYVHTIAEHLSADELRALGRWLKASAIRLERLQVALDERARRRAGGDRAGNSHSLLRRITHLFGK